MNPAPSAAHEIVAKQFDEAGLYGIAKSLRTGGPANAYANIAVNAVEAALQHGVSAATMDARARR